MSNQVLYLHQVSKSFTQGDVTVDVLRSTTLELHAGQAAAIVGPSGSGKSTLLQIAGLLEQADSGHVVIHGQSSLGLTDLELTRLRNRSIGFVYQFHHLLPEFSALENVMLPALAASVSHAKATSDATVLLEQLGLTHRLHHRPAELSGGEQQRVAIARALINHPALLLADEPTGNLDDEHARSVFELLMRVAQECGTAILMVTHNQALAKQMHAIYQMQAGSVVLQPHG